MTARVALAHDYATQRGGAERVALLLADAFPGSPLYTTLYDAAGTFPEMADLDVRTTSLNRFGPLRRHHRYALPFLARAVSRQVIDADVVLASSTGWAHGFPTSGSKVVYCHAPARWLYQRDRYLGAGRRGESVAQRASRWVATGMLGVASGPLRRWDEQAARTADVYLANSTVTQRAVQVAYGIDAEVVAPPPALLPTGDESRPEILDRSATGRSVQGDDFLLCVARLLPYKNVDAVVAAAARRPDLVVLVVGSGPDRARLDGLVASGGHRNVLLLGRVSDAELRWLYRSCIALVAASYEDYGLSPLEAAAFGRPSVVLRDGGYLDTVAEGTTGTFFDRPGPDEIAAAVGETLEATWAADVLQRHARTFSAAAFTSRLRSVVDGELDRHDMHVTAGRSLA
ncbi:glycosyltransferase [Sanguibacter antarcticus]|uniref:D-inositol 3-phosphate glycosyltransferase n=1 Tax=Sanguibacter antarcticus TaxID=372484 RepID=A0A2A9E2A3_9MICO|nr:glycosyltransferase [Sanguibacter antarcticus]PFG32332.1 glycosyltransferase involved in cell wall biosynthesis [Sanguibacter antarcticus]